MSKGKELVYGYWQGNRAWECFAGGISRKQIPLEVQDCVKTQGEKVVIVFITSQNGFVPPEILPDLRECEVVEKFKGLVALKI